MLKKKLKCFKLEDKVLIFIVATIVILALILIFAVPAIIRSGKVKANEQEVKAKPVKSKR